MPEFSPGRWQDEAVSMRVSDGSGNFSGIPGKYGADIVEYDFSNHHSDLFVELSVRQRGCGSDDGL